MILQLPDSSYWAARSFGGCLLAALLLALAPTLLPAQASSANARQLFANHCGRCHGMQGGGGTGPSLQRPILGRAPDDQSLASIIAYGISGTGMPGSWMLSPEQVADLVVYVRELGKTKGEPITGDAAKGKELFEQKGACMSCHIVEGEGESLGPDLSAVGLRRGVAYLREAIQHPGKNKPLDREGFQTYLVVEAELKTGAVVRGVRINEDTFSIQIRSADNRIYSFRKRDLKTLHVRQDQSLMPSFQDRFSPEEMDHLTAFLASLTD